MSLQSDECLYFLYDIAETRDKKLLSQNNTSNLLSILRIDIFGFIFGSANIKQCFGYRWTAKKDYFYQFFLFIQNRKSIEEESLLFMWGFPFLSHVFPCFFQRRRTTIPMEQTLASCVWFMCQNELASEKSFWILSWVVPFRMNSNIELRNEHVCRKFC